MSARFHPARLWKLVAVFLSVSLVLTSCTLTREGRKKKLLRSGNEYAAKGKFREAAIQYLNAIELDPKYVDAHFALGKTALKLGDANTAYYEFEQVTELTPTNMEAQLHYGNLLLARGNWKEAKRRAEMVREAQPQNAEARLLMAQVYGMQGDVEHGLTEVQAAIAAMPNRPEPILVLASLNLQRRQVADAESNYLTALNIDNKNVDAMLGLALLYEQQSKWTEAEQFLKQAVSAAPQDTQARSMLIVLYVSRDKRAEAEALARATATELAKDPSGYRMLANFYIWTGQVGKARDEYGVLAKLHKQDWETQKTYVQLLILTNQIEEAEKLNNSLMGVLGADPDVLIERAQILMKKGEPEDAITQLKTALSLSPNNYLGHFYQGLAVSMTGDMEGAEREWREAARLQPDRPELQVALAGVGEARSDLALLAKASDRLLKIAPLDAASYVVKAHSEFSQGRRAVAAALLKQAIQVQPENPLPYASLAEARILQKNYAEAEKLLNTAIEKDPNYYWAMQVLLTMYTGQGQRAKAIARTEEQIAKAPNNSYFYLLLGALKLGQKDVAGGEAALKKATELSPRNAEAWRLLGTSQASRGAVDEAIATFSQWKDAIPTDARAYLSLGLLNDGKNNWKAAQEYYRKALQYDAGNATAANNLSYSLSEHNGNADEALSFAMAARAAMSDSPTALDTLGWAYYRKGQYELAVNMLEKALDKNPQSSAIHYHLGVSYEALKQWAKATDHLQKAMQLDPAGNHTDDARKALDEVRKKAQEKSS